jgi:hypothetical protein
MKNKSVTKKLDHIQKKKKIMRGYYYYGNGILKIAINSLLQSWSQYIWYMESTVVSWINEQVNQHQSICVEKRICKELIILRAN